MFAGPAPWDWKCVAIKINIVSVNVQENLRCYTVVGVELVALWGHLCRALGVSEGVECICACKSMTHWSAAACMSTL